MHSKFIKNTVFWLIVFFSPVDVSAFFNNFPSFKQKGTLIACFGEATVKMAEEYDLNVNITAPNQYALSMADAITQYIDNNATT